MKIAFVLSAILLLSTSALAKPPFFKCSIACIKAWRAGLANCDPDDSDCISYLCASDRSCYEACRAANGGPKYHSDGYDETCADDIQFPRCSDPNAGYEVGSDGLKYGFENDRSCLIGDDYETVYGRTWKL
ncbi:hypothetical protein HK098_002335 [Nowakowskiella sp. JEL0407]|nr:hypothetical protein HK098_002335 [Nowakowskiella sp. JEL0407]